MVDTFVMIDSNNKIQNLKTINKKENLNTENKSDFKECLSKELNLKLEDNTKKESKELNVDKPIEEKSNNESELNSDKLASEISEKIEEFLNNEDFKIDYDDEVLEEIVSLLVSFLEVNLKEFNADTINTSEVNKISLDIGDTNLSKLFEEKKSSALNFDKETLLNNSKEILKNINNLLEEYINSSDNNIVLNDFNTVDEVKLNLLDEIKNLMNIIPSNSIEKIEDKLNTDVTKEIFNTLLLNANKDLEPKNNIKDDTQKNNINSDTMINIETNKGKSEFKIDSQEMDNEENLNKENSFKDNIVNKKEDSINKREEEILMKFLDDDNSQSFSKTLTYYDKLNKINSTVEVIKEPISINKETINLDIIKNVKYMIRNSVEELNIKIYPKELGEMTIKILSEEGIMKAEIKATSKETYNLLNSNINEIKKTLENQNIMIQEVNIGIYNEDTTFFSGKENSRENLNQNNNNEKSFIFEDNETLEDLIIDNNINFLA